MKAKITTQINRSLVRRGEKPSVVVNEFSNKRIYRDRFLFAIFRCISCRTLRTYGSIDNLRNLPLYAIDKPENLTPVIRCAHCGRTRTHLFQSIKTYDEAGQIVAKLIILKRPSVSSLLQRWRNYAAL